MDEEIAMIEDTYQITRDPKNPKRANGCIDIVQSHDDGGWYAHQYDFTREDNATRVSATIYSTREALVLALDAGDHNWQKWD